jgi:hypothetical protein
MPSGDLDEARTLKKAMNRFDTGMKLSSRLPKRSRPNLKCFKECCRQMLFRLAIFSVLAVLATPGSGWSAPPPTIISPGTTSEPARFSGIVAAHNRARHAVGVPDLRWSPELAGTAQRWANQLGAQNCAMRHSGAPGIGENLTWASGQRLSPTEVVASWVQEARSFNGPRGVCLPGAVCGHYTQVVWRSTRFVGCGMVSCGGSEVWVCNYSPPGNYVGERPY